MKEKYRKIIGITFICLMTFMGMVMINKMKEKKKIEIKITTIPDFDFIKMNRVNYSKVDLRKNKMLVFIYFNSECDYCQYEAKSISESIEQFQDVQLLFVSTEPIDTIKNFAENYNLLQQPNITFLHDSTNTFSNRFDATSIPYVLIYDAQHQLIKKHKGQLKAEAILELLK